MRTTADETGLPPDGAIATSDPTAYKAFVYEAARQHEKIILIPSESMAPLAVREALSTVFTNIYAEGYPSLRTLHEDEGRLGDLEMQTALHRRFADRRFYRGTEYADVVEALARRRIAELFAAAADPSLGFHLEADDILANVQALSGAAANNAVYEAVLKPGDTIMGMSLTHGGHLTHGSPYNRSGRYFNVVSYGVSEETGRLDYDQIERLALEHKPRMIVAGASAYPWDIDWRRLREIADQVPGRAFLLADIAHPAGLVVAGLFPNPIGYADFVNFTTHKTLIGPRGAVILTTDEALAKKVDRAVFPGEQGGPHLNNIAAMAVSFKLAQREEFKALQRGIIANAAALAEGLTKRGYRLAYGGTNTHLLLVDLKPVHTKTGKPLMGDTAARLLDSCGIVCNMNTIPGDLNAAHSSAIRLGTVWATQRGITEAQMDGLAEAIHTVLSDVTVFSYAGASRRLWRGKVELAALQSARAQVKRIMAALPGALPEMPESETMSPPAQAHVIEVRGPRAQAFLHEACTADIVNVPPQGWQRALLLNADGALVDEIVVVRPDDKPNSATRFYLAVNGQRAASVVEWLRSLSDGCTLFDRQDIRSKIQGPVVVEDLTLTDEKGRRLAAVHGRGADALEALTKALALSEAPESRRAAEVALGEGRAVLLRGALDDGPGFVLMASPENLARVAEVLPRNRQPSQALGSLGADDGSPDLATVTGIAERTPDRFLASKPYFIGQSLLNLPAGEPKPEFRFEPYAGEARRSSLYEENVRLTGGRNIVPFAGWSMPVWYSSIGEEHRAVRQAAGLFDVTHMGVLEVRGQHAARFLDLVTTNYVPSLTPGQAHYSFVLDPRGSVMDDILVYCLAPDQFMLVVNAANAEKVKAWLDAVNTRQVRIDLDDPGKQVDVAVLIRDLKDESAGHDRKVDVSLQGPASLEILQRVAPNENVRYRLAHLRRSEFLSTRMGEVEALVSRTGYTGEDLGYELYVHPDQAPELWHLLLEEGASRGARPAALGARDSLRTEAGFPLYGHELAGPYDVTPAEAGYGSFVKMHKPFFIGRQGYGRRLMTRKMAIARFSMNERGVRMAKTGDPVVNRRGECIGYVTSATAVEGMQVGLAYVDRRFSAEGTPIGVFPLPRDAGRGEAPKTELKPGERVLVHEAATVLSRFPAKPATG